VVRALAATLVALAGALLVVSAHRLDAQSPDQPDAAAIARLQRAAERSDLVATVAYLTDVYGARLTGSPHLKAAADYLIARLTAWGVRGAKYERWGPFGPGWTSDRLTAMALAPQSYSLIAYPKAWTPGTDGELVAEAVLAPIADQRDFERFHGRLAGKFVLTSAPTDVPALAAPSPLSADDLRKLAAADAAPVATERREAAQFARERMEFFLKEDAAVLLEPGGRAGGTVLAGDGRLRDDAEVNGPGFYPWPDAVAAQVVLASEQYNRIARTLERGVPVTLEMNITNTYHPAEPDSFNIIVEIPGTSPGGEVVMLGAHFDSWHAGTGASDNAAGVAIVAEAMRLLKASGVPLKRTVRLALWTGSEQGLSGSRAYVTEHFANPGTMQPKPEHARVAAYFNVDGGSGAIRGIYTDGNRAAADVLEKSIAPFRERGMTVVSPQAGERSDHFSFNVVGIPGFHFIQDPVDRLVRGTNMDIFDRLDTSHLVQNALIVAAIVYQAANRDEMLPRKPTPAPNAPWAFPQLPRR
jgi:hypothetical protein